MPGTVISTIHIVSELKKERVYVCVCACIYI